MKTKHVAILIGLAAAVVAADYTVPKSWTRSGAEYAKAATLIFDPVNTDTAIELRVRVKTVADERIDTWTPATVARLPDTIVVGGNTVTNLFKTHMQAVFTRINIVRAYNWSLVDGREASMVPH